MKVNKLTQLLIDERLIKPPNPYDDTAIEVVDKPINTEDFYIHFQNDIPYKLLVRILGKPFSKKNDESIWNVLVHEDGFKRPCQFVYEHSIDVLDTWARNEKTALNARGIVMGLKDSNNLGHLIEIPKTTKPKVDIE